jgi:hypothetical protein
VSGWSVVGGAQTITIPAGTASIPAKGHLLLTGSGYSLNDYGGTGLASGDVTYSGDIAVGTTLTLRNASEGPVDVVSGSGLPTPTPGSQYSYARRLNVTTKQPVDSGTDGSDFNLVEVTPTTLASPQSNGPDNTSDSSARNGKLRLGSPGPENRSSPVSSSFVFGLVDPSQGANTSGTPNAQRTSSGNDGTLALRRTVTNRTGSTVRRLRLRISGITAGTPTGDNAASIADVRLIDAATAMTFTINGVPIEVKPSKVETVANQTSDATTTTGGALNSTLTVELPGAGLAPDGVLGIEFLLKVVKSGTFRIDFFYEALP